MKRLEAGEQGRGCYKELAGCDRWIGMTVEQMRHRRCAAPVSSRRSELLRRRPPLPEREACSAFSCRAPPSRCGPTGSFRRLLPSAEANSPWPPDARARHLQSHSADAIGPPAGRDRQARPDHVVRADAEKPRGPENDAGTFRRGGDVPYLETASTRAPPAPRGLVRFLMIATSPDVELRLSRPARHGSEQPHVRIHRTP